MGAIQAVIFDMDGVLVDSEHLWDVCRAALTTEWGGIWRPEAQLAMMGMSSGEWSRYMHEQLGIPQSAEAINAEVVRRMLVAFQSDAHPIPGAAEAVRCLSGAFPLAVASSANRPVIDAFLAGSGLAPHFRAVVSSEEVPRGKPAPDVYLEAARLLGVPPTACGVVEDSTNGLKGARAAGMAVIAYPNRVYPPSPEVLATVDLVLTSLDELTAERLSSLSASVAS